LASDALALQSAPVATKSGMNGNGSKIEIFKPFGEAFELMKKILFQPFDLKKWFVIGFAAWLANLGGGGVAMATLITRTTIAEMQRS
jgi:hypothetical protein